MSERGGKGVVRAAAAQCRARAPFRVCSLAVASTVKLAVAGSQRTARTETRARALALASYRVPEQPGARGLYRQSTKRVLRMRNECCISPPEYWDCSHRSEDRIVIVGDRVPTLSRRGVLLRG